MAVLVGEELNLVLVVLQVLWDIFMVVLEVKEHRVQRLQRLVGLGYLELREVAVEAFIIPVAREPLLQRVEQEVLG